jgi:hypothetical protein
MRHSRENPWLLLLIRRGRVTAMAFQRSTAQVVLPQRMLCWLARGDLHPAAAQYALGLHGGTDI